MTTGTTEKPPTSGIPRRSFLKWSGIAGGGVALVGTGVSFGLLPGVGPANAVSPAAAGAADKIVWSSCNVNCGSRCPLRMQVRDGQIVRVLPDDTGDDKLGTQQIRACVRGRSIRHRIYNPDRLKSPMRRRPGTKRGAGQWDKITWEEAFDEIASTMQRLIKDYGNESIYLNYGTGTLGGTITRSWPPSETPVARLMNCVGGYLNHYCDYSAAQIETAVVYHYGGWIGSNSFDDAKNAKLQVMFGNNPLETRMSGGGETFVTQQTKKLHGVRTIVIDPRYSETALSIADEWIALRPGTDTALIAGVAHVMISENLVDQEFLDTYTVGFDEDHMPEGIPAGNSYKAYIMGDGSDGVEKTPEWAAAITGVPASTIVRFARELGTARPVQISQGWGPQRSANGENQSRAIFTLAALTGSIGVAGGGTGEREGAYGLPMVNAFGSTSNPVKASISVFGWTDAIDHGSEMTALNAGVQGVDKLDVPIKMVWQYAGNALTNQHADINRTTKLLEDDTKCEFIVVIDNQMTVSARYADILLPDTSNTEQLDIVQQGSAGNMGYAIVADKVIEPLFDTKTIYEMMTEIAKRLGVEQQFTEGKTQEDWVRQVVEDSQPEVPGLPDFASLREMGVWKVKSPDASGNIGLKSFRADPVANPLKTPSGKIEIFSSQLWEMAKTWELPEGDKITALPEHRATWESAEEARTNKKYPLQCIGHHYKQRTHSTYGNVDWMREAHPQVVWMNPVDATARGLENDDLVEVFNDRGRIRLPVRVTPRIAPGVLSVPQGAWYAPDKNGVDVGGAVNTLTSWRPTAVSKGNAQHTALVQVEKA